MLIKRNLKSRDLITGIKPTAAPYQNQYILQSFTKV